MKIFAETERLLLREIVPEDLDGFFELDSDPEVHRYLGNRPVSDKNKLLEIIGFVRQQYLDHGIGRWAVVEKSSNRFIGWCGLKKVTETVNHHIHFHDLGYRLIQSYWGQGYATESARAALAYGFYTLMLDEIYAATHMENLASQRILTKLGFRFMETFDDDGAKNHWYKIQRGQ